MRKNLNQIVNNSQPEGEGGMGGLIPKTNPAKAKTTSGQARDGARQDVTRLAWLGPVCYPQLMAFSLVPS